MADTTVYFATNRKADPMAPGGFGSDIIAPLAGPTYAVVPVTGIDLGDEGSGQLGAVTGTAQGAFNETVAAEIEASGRNLLVFIHGFDNTFEDAIKRAAFIREWFGAAGVAAADATVLAFTWPSAGVLFDSLPSPPQAAYLADQAMAARSAGHLAGFLRGLDPLLLRVHSLGGRAFLLAHSMGNHALSNAVPDLFAGAAASPPRKFDEAILAAADEVDTTLGVPHAGMFRLRDLASRITTYSSLRDVAMNLSISVNRNIRLGYTGPDRKSDDGTYPPAQFRSVDCTQVFDFNGLARPDATHQYYRRSPAVRADIASLMAGMAMPGGVLSLQAFPFGL